MVSSYFFLSYGSMWQLRIQISSIYRVCMCSPIDVMCLVRYFCFDELFCYSLHETICYALCHFACFSCVWQMPVQPAWFLILCCIMLIWSLKYYVAWIVIRILLALQFVHEYFLLYLPCKLALETLVTLGYRGGFKCYCFCNCFTCKWKQTSYRLFHWSTRDSDCSHAPH